MDSGTMVRAAGDEMGTVRVASTMSDGANTMIEHDGTLLSQLGTMVINAEDEEEEGTMKSKALIKYPNFSGRPYTSQKDRFTWSTQAQSGGLFCCCNQRSRTGCGEGTGLGKGKAGM